MRSKSFKSVLLLTLLLIGGCIVGDQVTTLTISPDGSADFLVFRSNIRSSEAGDRGERELADYKSNFDGKTDEEMSRISKAGGQVLAASWVRLQAPYSNFVHAFFPNASALEKFLSEHGRDDGHSITTQFHIDGSRRRLTIRVTMPLDTIPSFESSSDVKQLRQMHADGISETRIAVTRGSITSAHGFAIAADKQSALLNVADIAQTLRMGQGKADLHLEWEVIP
jgi:hypothetical protein